jgi:3,4-dihydroxy 2-butanone 4-phosphate synthase / GTP cyclohydrolase II
MAGFSQLEEALDALANGRVIIVADAEERENEGDFVAAAEKVTSETVHFMISEGRGQLCMPLLGDIARRLNLKPMVPRSDVESPCFAVPVDHRFCRTGISPKERAFTIQMIVDASSKPGDFIRPGHIFPLIARDGGVLARQGHTEATVDLVRLAGLKPAGILCEICSRDGQHMACGDELMEIGEALGTPIITIADVIRFRQRFGYDTPPRRNNGAHSAPLVPRSP